MNDCLLTFKKLTNEKNQKLHFLTERELRSEYLDQNFTKNERKNPTKLKQVADRIPDFVIMEGERRIAYEVELTQKSAKRYLEKMKRYQDEIMKGRYSRVRYLCETDQIKKTVITHAKRAGVESNMLQLDLIGRLLAIGQKQ